MKKALAISVALWCAAQTPMLVETARAGVVASGGTMTNNNGYILHKFTCVDQPLTPLVTNLTVLQGGDVEVLIVAGGGGGGKCAGGGGAGGLIYTSAYALAVGSTNVSVGLGGAGRTDERSRGFPGGDSSFGSLTAVGGGGGGGGGWDKYSPESQYAGGSGGSGGGSVTTNDAPGSGTAGPPRQGWDGGYGVSGSAGGGGGGAGSPGISAWGLTGGNGGNGRQFTNFASVGGSPAGWFAGGGGGGAVTAGGVGGNGGGGNGSKISTVGGSAVTNTGGGGGGGGTALSNGGNGAAGIVVVRYRAAPLIANLPATNITSSEAWLNGYLSFTGNSPVTVSVYWGNTDGGDPTSGLWKATNKWAESDWVEGSYPTYRATGLVENTTYYYRYYGTNSAGPAWPPASRYFLASDETFDLSIEGAPSRHDSPAANGIATIAYGLNTIPAGIMLTNSVTSPAADAGDQALRQRWVCTGWNVTNDTGAAVSNGIGTQAVFQLSTNMVLTWYWTNQLELATARAGTNGSVNSGEVDGWYTNGALVAVLATPAGGYGFYRWWGDVPAGAETNNPLFVTMDRARTLTAQWSGETRRWNGTGDWHVAISNWNPVYPPCPLDDAILNSGTAFISTSTAMKSLTMTNSAGLGFTNWLTKLTASNIVIRRGSVVSVAYGANIPSDAAMPNRVYFACSTFVLDGTIDVSRQGYCGGGAYDGGGDGAGPGKGGGRAGWSALYAGGGGYGGRGGAGNGTRWADWSPGDPSLPFGGIAYGSADPAGAGFPGSGGGGNRDTANGAVGVGGSGGGAVRIEASGKVTLKGNIVASGGNNQHDGSHGGGGGSGGGVVIICSSIDASSTGTVQAAGGNGGYQYSNGGAGGGGRIAIQYDPAAQALEATPNIKLSAGLYWGWNKYLSDPTVRSANTEPFPYMTCPTNPLPEFGTIYLTDGQLLTAAILVESTGRVYGVTNWMPSSLTLTNRDWTLCEPSVRMRLEGNLVIGSNATLKLPLRNNRLDCGGNLVVTNGGRLAIFSGPTNGIAAGYGALVSVTGTVWIGSNSWLYPYSDTNDGGSALFVVSNLTLAGGAVGGIDASGLGFAAGKGPGVGGTGGGGGGYGGTGGWANAAQGGRRYGSPYLPTDPGSGSGHTNGGAGGGVIRIAAKGAVVGDGVLRANGAAGTVNGGGAGSGGGILVMCEDFSGDPSGILEANGGNSDPSGGGGGGGRIAVWYDMSVDDWARILAGSIYPQTKFMPNAGYLGAVSVANGTGAVNPPDTGAAEPGSIIFATFFTGTLIEIR